MRLRAAALAAVVCLTVPAIADEQWIGLIVEPFSGEGNLGRRSATFLNLQVWQTLRRAPPNNTHHLDFGNGIVYWDEREVPPKSHQEAARIGQESSNVDLVLWGTANQYGGGVVVQAYLTVPNASKPANPGARIWAVAPRGGGERRTIAVDIPAWTYDFAPIVLRPDLIPELNTPEGIPMYDGSLTTRIGSLRPDFRALEQAGDRAKVTSGGQTGWVKIRGLSTNRSEVTDFSGAMIRVFRKDWKGAIDLLTRVVANSRTPAAIKISSYLLMAASSHNYSVQTGEPDGSLGYVAAAEKLNPYLQMTARYKCVALLEAAQRGAADAPDRWNELQATLQRNEYLFAKGDRWLSDVKSAVSAHAQPGR